MAARTYYTAVAQALTTISGTAYVDKLSVAIPSPIANSQVIWIWHCAQGNLTNATSDSKVLLVQKDSLPTSVNYAEINRESVSAAESKYSAGGIAFWSPGAIPLSTNFMIQGAAETDTNNCIFKDASLIGIVLTGNDFVSAAEATTASVGLLTTFASMTTTTPAATYTLLASGELKGAANASLYDVRASLDGVFYGQMIGSQKDATNWISWAFSAIVTLTNAAHTFKIAAASDSSNTLIMRRIRWAFLDHANFDNNYYVYNRVTAATTSIGVTILASIAVSTSVAGNYLVLAGMNPGLGATAGGSSCTFAIVQDATTLANSTDYSQGGSNAETPNSNFFSFMVAKAVSVSTNSFTLTFDNGVSVALGATNLLIGVHQLDSSAPAVPTPKGPRLGANPMKIIGVGRSDFTYPLNP